MGSEYQKLISEYKELLLFLNKARLSSDSEIKELAEQHAKKWDHLPF